MGQPTAEQALRALEPLVGEWTVELAGPDGQPWPGRGVSTLEWHPSGAHLVQRTTVGVPGAPDSTSIIGCDNTAGTYLQLYSDERGVCRIYSMTIDSEQWILRRDGEPFPQRFTAQISADGNTIAGRWEKDVDGTGFTTDFFLTYHRTAAAAG